MLTTMEEEVLELCTSTVTNTPITSPATGLDNTTLSLKISPAALPAHTHKQLQAKNIPYTQHELHFFLIMAPNNKRNSCESILPPTSWKAELRTSSEQINR